MAIGVYILNYNGRDLLELCLPSVLRAAAASSHECRLTVVDNASTDDSLAWLAQAHPQVAIDRQPNQGLSSYNAVLAAADVDVAILLNNDIRLAEDCLDPLVAPLIQSPPTSEGGCFMSAPLCWLFDGRTYEGFRTAVTWRWGLVQATALFPGHEPAQLRAGLTASAGAALAVDRRAFVALGGFDPLYLPGRLEDLDFAYRGYQAGWHARYVPAAVAYHRGQATFTRELGTDASHLLALRNTLLFQWKNLRHPRHLCRQFLSLPVRLAWDLLRAPAARSTQRLLTWRALVHALGRAWRVGRNPSPRINLLREREYFEQFHPARMSQTASAAAQAEADDARESKLARRHPISRWYLCPLASGLSRRLARSRVRPAHCTLAGVVAAVGAGALIVSEPGSWLLLAAVAVLVAWFCDRLDGPLARRQKSANSRGAWLDANIDELIDLGLQICVAQRAAQSTASQLPWLCLVAFLCGKYLLFYGTASDDRASTAGDSHAARPVARRRLRWLYHLPGNADVRVHLLALALATGCLNIELAIVAVYYNLRWVLRYASVATRPGVAWQEGAAP